MGKQPGRDDPYRPGPRGGHGNLGSRRAQRLAERSAKLGGRHTEYSERGGVAGKTGLLRHWISRGMVWCRVRSGTRCVGTAYSRLNGVRRECRLVWSVSSVSKRKAT